MAKLVWFRDDLRVLDNPALYAACNNSGESVYAVFLVSGTQWKKHDWADIKIDLIKRRIKRLSEELASLNIQLLVLDAASFEDVPHLLVQVCKELDVSDVYFNSEVGVNEHRRDSLVEDTLRDEEIAARVFENRAIYPPGSILTGKGLPFTVFTPFKKAWLRKFQLEGLECLGRPQPQAVSQPTQEFPQAAWPNSTSDSSHWPVDERSILDKLREFAEKSLHDYGEDRDFPAIDGTSHLSPYLTIGAISARQCISRLLFNAQGDFHALSPGAQTWLSELIWRDFYRHLMVAYPKLSMHYNFKEGLASLEWNDDENMFEAWKNGQTGYPLVDAGMRQLNSTGWMHNRVRMVVASFLTKHLLIDWRKGEQYFMRKLIDGDFAANNGGWQWAASTGADAVPYFRIFNPHLQAKRFDPDGSYIRRWIPELSDEEVKLATSGKTPQFNNPSYPAPIVDHAQAREKALKFFKRDD
ncbi:deoxyribodipyrimidine photo-lyase [Corallincola platygyrae]|uniref:Deoxyribodipyrimidine photo-lyase n=1 Tax=Corallincola platygyrae TaxID=1193278 RepID=A0ABW4XP14_9GAMM